MTIIGKLMVNNAVNHNTADNKKKKEDIRERKDIGFNSVFRNVCRPNCGKSQTEV